MAFASRPVVGAGEHELRYSAPGGCCVVVAGYPDLRVPVADFDTAALLINSVIWGMHGSRTYDRDDRTGHTGYE